MIDYQELKRLAEAVESADHYISRSLAVTALANAANPATVLALIAEFEASGLYWMAERDKLRAEVERLREITKFDDAVACVFDYLKIAAANTSDQDWDDRLEELAGEVIEYSPRYKRKWKSIISLSAERDQLKAEVEALRKDAERYRWLRDTECWDDAQQNIDPLWIVNSRDGVINQDGIYLDAAIDAAIQQETK